jgi:hypothetical protein
MPPKCKNNKKDTYTQKELNIMDKIFVGHIPGAM